MKLHIPLSDGTTLTFEGSHDELMGIAERFVDKHGPLVSQAGNGMHGEAPHGMSTSSSRRWTEQAARRLWGLLYGEQAKVVKALVSRGGTTEYHELGKHMGYDAQHLSGVLSAITRNSQTATGDRLARLVDWRVADSGKRVYFIHPDALPFFQQLLKQQP